MTPRATMSKSPRRSRPRPAPSLPNCRPRSPRPSATSISPRCARRSTAPSPTAWSTTGDFIVVGTAARQCGAARRRLHRCQFQGNPAQAHPSRPAGDDLGRCLWPPQVRRHRRQHLAGGGLGVHAAAAGQRHRQFHQDRAAAAGPRPRAEGRRAGRTCCARACRSMPPSTPREGARMPTATPISTRRP